MSVSPQKHPAAETPAGPVPFAGGSRHAENLVLLAHDDSLREALASVVAGSSLVVVGNEAALAQQLVNGHVGVVFIDAGLSPVGTTAQLTQKLHHQMPDVVLVVAGDGAVQSELAALVADGTVYRFVHKPASAQRLKLFVDAAWRKREGGSGASGVFPALTLPQPPVPTDPPRGAFPWMPVAATVCVVVAALAGYALYSHGAAGEHPLTATVARSDVQRVRSVLTPAAPSAAVAPAPAADLDRFATGAEQALLAGDLDEAARLTDAARAVDPNHVRVKFLTAQIAREQARQNARRRAAALAAEAQSASSPSADSTPNPAPTPAPMAAPSAPSPAPVAQVPVVAASVTTSTDGGAAATPFPGSPPSSTPPASEARDRNSVAAVILQRVYSVDPVFPDAARERDLTGFVDLEFTVLANGTVADVNVLKAQPNGVFEKSAVAAVRQWRYRPVERDGVPVNEHARLRLNFAYK